MKNKIKLMLQKIAGFSNYLFVFAVYKVFVLRFTKEEKSFFYFLSLMKVSSNVLDIGANVGYMSILLAKKSHKGVIFAFEPIPIHLTILKKLLVFFNISNVNTFSSALGNEIGKVNMIMPVVNDVKLQGLSHVIHKSIDGSSIGEIFNVNVETLDSKLEYFSNFGRIHGIKIDVENFEYFVFEGAIELIKKDLPIIYCELWNNENRRKSFELLINLGYEVKCLENKQLKNTSVDDLKNQNFFFIHPMANMSHAQ